jgi:hypothetical protein
LENNIKVVHLGTPLKDIKIGKDFRKLIISFPNKSSGYGNSRGRIVHLASALCIDLLYALYNNIPYSPAFRFAIRYLGLCWRNKIPFYISAYCFVPYPIESVMMSLLLVSFLSLIHSVDAQKPNGNIRKFLTIMGIIVGIGAFVLLGTVLYWLMYGNEGGGDESRGGASRGVRGHAQISPERRYTERDRDSDTQDNMLPVADVEVVQSPSGHHHHRTTFRREVEEEEPPFLQDVADQNSQMMDSAMLDNYLDNFLGEQL